MKYLGIYWDKIFILLYAISLACIFYKVASYKRVTRVHGGFDYGCLEQQGFYTRAAIAVALNTSLASIVITVSSKEIPIFLPLSGMACIFIAILLTK